MFSIALSLIALVLYDNMKSRSLFWLLYIIIIAPVSLVFFEWYFVGITMVLMYHIIRNETARRIIPPLFAAVIFFLIAYFTRMIPETAQFLTEAGIFSESALIMNAEFPNIMLVFPLGIVLAGFLLLGYNGERGKSVKWLFYVFYPLHLAVLVAGIWLIGRFF
jgi:hypothetical protein